MKILILGGTRFLGRYLTEYAIQSGHEVTLFNRGNEKSNLFSNIEYLIGDRNGNLEALKGRKWDAVIDTCGFVPRAVRESVELLSQSVGHYTFISSGSVYRELAEEGIDELHPVNELSMEEAEEMTKGTAGPIYNEYYGHLKVLCEQELLKRIPSKSLIIRAGLIVGPYDYTDRFSYWVGRVAKGGEVLAPGRKDSQLQLIDVRDLASWIIKTIEKNVTGTFNVTGPNSVLTMERFLETCKATLNKEANFTWVGEDFLLEQNVAYWSELPFWIPDKLNSPGFLSLNIDRAINEGLEFRPLEQTIQDTFDWKVKRGEVTERKAGLDPNKEINVLKAWNNKGIS